MKKEVNKMNQLIASLDFQDDFFRFVLDEDKQQSKKTVCEKEEHNFTHPEGIMRKTLQSESYVNGIVAIVEESWGAGPGWCLVENPAKILVTGQPIKGESLSFAIEESGIPEIVVSVWIQSISETELLGLLSVTGQSEYIEYEKGQVFVQINQIVTIACLRDLHDAGVSYKLGYWTSDEEFKRYLENYEQTRQRGYDVLFI